MQHDMLNRIGAGLTTGLEEARPRLLFFYSRTDGLSRRVEAYLAQVLQRHRNHETFQLIRVAVEENAELAERFAIEKIPTLIVIDANKPRVRLEAPRNRAPIETMLSPWLRGASSPERHPGDLRDVEAPRDERDRSNKGVRNGITKDSVA